MQWRLDRARDDAPRPTGHVPATFFWVVDDADPQTYLGRSPPHGLTPPSRSAATSATRSAGRRHRGPAAGSGIDPALVTCDVDNVGSAAVIEANGGVLEDVRGTKKRYWVPTGG